VNTPNSWACDICYFLDQAGLQQAPLEEGHVTLGYDHRMCIYSRVGQS